MTTPRLALAVALSIGLAGCGGEGSTGAAAPTPDAASTAAAGPIAAARSQTEDLFMDAGATETVAACIVDHLIERAGSLPTPPGSNADARRRAMAETLVESGCVDPEAAARLSSALVEDGPRGTPPR